MRSLDKTISTNVKIGPLADPMIATIPIHEPMNTIIEGRRGAETHVTDEIIDIGERGLHVAGLHREHFLSRGPPELLLQKGDNVHQFCRLVVADIINAPGS